MANYVSESTEADIGEAKKKITPQYIYDALAADRKKLLSELLLVYFSAAAMIFVLIIILNVASPLNEQGTMIADIVLTAILLCVVVIALFKYFRNTRKVSDDDYTIVVDKIENVSIDDKEIVIHSRHHTTVCMEHAVYLCRCGRVVVSYADAKVQSNGDTVYVLVKKKHPDKAIMSFNAKNYELVGLSVEEPKKQKEL